MGAPIQGEFRETMNAVAGGLDEIFNGKASGDDRQVGFVLLTFKFGETDGGRVNYISNAEREDMLAAMREWLARAEGRAVDHRSAQ
jgi:hypothetical protein